MKDDQDSFISQVREKVLGLLNKSEEIWQKDIDRALELTIDALGLIIPDAPDFKESHALCLSKLGFYYGVKGKYSVAFNQLNKALKLYEELDDQINQVDVLRSIGGRFIDIGDFEKALDLTTRSIEMAEKINYAEGITRGLNNLGVVNDRTNNYDQAEKIYLQVLELHIESGNVPSQCKALNNLADVYMHTGDLEKAEQFALQSLALTEEAGEDNHKISALCTLGEVLSTKGEFDQAQKNFQMSLDLARKVEYSFVEAYVLLALARTNVSQQNLEMAISAARQAAELAEEINARWIELNSYQVLLEIYKEMKDFETALEYSDKYHSIKDEIQTDKLQKELARLKIQWGIEEELD